MNVQQILVFQDGGQFYSLTSGALVADYGDTGDYAVARRLRERFVREHGECRLATPEELHHESDRAVDESDYI